MSLSSIVWIGLGGALGAIARAAIGAWISTDFPWATLLVNIVGSLLFGVVMGLSAKAQLPWIDVRSFVAIGFCGAFTTFSTFSFQTLMLIQQNQIGTALLNIGVTLVLTLAAVGVGLKVAHWV